MIRKFLFSSVLVLALLFVLSAACSPGTHSPLTIETRKGVSGNEYVLYYKNAAKISFEITRPSKVDTSTLLCIPAAFTVLTDYSIDGLYICKGKTGNKNKINHTIGGAIKLVDGEITIFPSGNGKLLTETLIKTIEDQNGSLFQQIQMIENGKTANFKDVKLFQRRGIVLFKNGKIAIAESKSAITLKVFADDLSTMQAKDLLYTDMGSWDYGWYRDPENGKLIVIGHDHSQTDKQSNWVVFRK